jgi:hypothetical protein
MRWLSQLILWLALAFVLLALFVHSCTNSVRDGRLSRLPDELLVTGELYRNEGDFGVTLHSGEAAGVAVYGLSDGIAADVARRGVDFFSLPDWRETPLDLTGQRLPDWAHPPPDPTVLDWIIGPLGQTIGVDPQVARDMNDAMILPGSYYRFGNGMSITLVVPATRKVYFAYGG